METMNQRRVNAAEAPPVATTGVASVFAMGGAPAPTSEPEAAKPGKEAEAITDQVVAAIKAAGTGSSVSVSKATGLPRQKVSVAMNGLYRRGVLEPVGKDGITKIYQLAPTGAAPVQKAGGFKGWLEKKGQQTAEGRSWQKKGKTPQVRAGGSEGAVVPVAMPAIRCGLFNDGELRIEAAGQPELRLVKSQARQLVDYLDMIRGALEASAGATA